MHCENKEVIELVGGPQDGLEIGIDEVISPDGDIYLIIKLILSINKDLDKDTFNVAEYEYHHDESKYYFTGEVYDTDWTDGLVDTLDTL